MTTTEETNKLRQHVLRCMCRGGEYVSALGWLRYEIVRTMRPDQFADLHNENIQTNTPFDTLIDRLILKQP